MHREVDDGDRWRRDDVNEEARSPVAVLVPGDAGRAAVRLLANLVQREALVMTYNDALLLIGGLFVAALFVMPLVRRPRATPVSPGH